jgi:hypothetical protein
MSRTTSSTLRRKRTLVALGALGGIAIAGVLGFQARKTLRAPQSQSAAATGRDQSGQRIACVFTPGTELAYELAIDTDITIDPARLNLPPGAVLNGPPPKRTTRATLALRATDLAPPAGSAAGAVLLARLIDVDPQTIQDAGDLSPSFLLEVLPTCKIDGFARLNTTAPLPARTQQALAHELQWQLPAGPRIQATGSNSFGKFEALFERNQRTDELAVDRRIQAYTQVFARDPRLGFGGTKGGNTPVISTQHVRLGAGPWFEKLEGHEKLVGLTVADTDGRTVATQVPMPARAFEGATLDPTRYVWEDMLSKSLLGMGRATSGAQDAAERAMLRKMPFKEAVDRFLARVKAGENISKLWPELAKYLEEHPDMAQKLAEMLRKQQLPPGATAAAFLALGRANVPEARDALWKLKDDAAARPIDRARSSFAMVDRKDVGVVLAESLRKDAQAVATGDTRETRIFARESALALGMMGGLKAESDPAVTQVAREAVTDLLQAGHDAITLRPAFAAAANIGDPALLGQVAPYTKSRDAGIRAAAAIIARRMPPEKTATATAEWLARESDPEVKRVLYHTVAAQTYDAQTVADPQIIEQAVRDLAAQPAPLTRQSLIKILGAAVGTSSAAKAALLRQAKIEAKANQGLLKLIATFIDGADLAAALRA